MPTFETVRFGELNYREEDVVRLPGGLIGLPDLQRWLILDMGEALPAKWLQSLDRNDFGVPVMQPYFYTDDYDPAIPDSVRRLIGCQSEQNLVILVITTVHDGGAKMTGNLLAPLVIDTESRQGIQLTLDDSRYQIRQEIDYFKFGLAVSPESSDNGVPAEGALQQTDWTAKETETVEL